MDKKKVLSVIKDICVVIIASVLSAFGLRVFVYPAEFAPSGIDGISAMLQEFTHINAGVYLILLNLPLLIWAFFKLNRKYVYYTIICTVLSSALLMLFEFIDVPQYTTESDKIISAIFAGVILGIRTGIMIKIGGSTGGTDIIGFVIQSKRPHWNIERIISVIGYVIIGLSYFVYGDINCILLSIIQIFVFEKCMSFVLKDNRNAVEVKIITKQPEILKEKILYELKHGATVINCEGMFTGERRFMVITIINIRQLGEISEIVKAVPDTFIYYTDVTGVKGNFRWKKDDLAK